MDLSHIRNFSIIAHIDHGKSTLADRIIEKCELVERRNHVEQMLDTMDIERERGITIKSNTVTLNLPFEERPRLRLQHDRHAGARGLHLRGFARAAACDGVLLVVDASQGVEAQTIANPTWRSRTTWRFCPSSTRSTCPAPTGAHQGRLPQIAGAQSDHAVLVSAKEGIGIDELLERIVEIIPPPRGMIDPPLSALVFDSYFDKYVGAVVKVRISTARPPR